MGELAEPNRIAGVTAAWVEKKARAVRNCDDVRLRSPLRDS
jgi:hypothetical protein